jgi:TPR repeat protein
MRPYVRPLIVTFSALALASLFSYAAIELTEPEPKATPKAEEEISEAQQEANQRKLFAKISAKAAAGDVEAMLDLGLAYSVGMGTPIDRVATVKWVRRAAELGHERAQYVYGQICQRGQYIPQDSTEAVRWFRLSAAQGNADAELSLAQAYEMGQGVAADRKESLLWLKLAATHGHPIAQSDYAFAILDEDDQARCEESAEWYRKSALQGNPKAMFNLAIMYQRGIGVPKDRINAYAWYLVSGMDGSEEIQEEVKKVLEHATASERRKAIERTKDIIAKLDIAPMFAGGSLSIELAERFHAQFQLAQLGKAEDQFELARMYHEGVGTVQDPFEASAWCRRAAEQGHVGAMRTLAMCLEDGDGVTVDLVEMTQWYRKAAEKDDPQSQFKLGVCYKDGTGVAADEKQAAFWTRKAADQGHPIAQANLGSFLLSGIDKSLFPEAVKWFKLSAKQGHPGGMYKYGLALFGGMGVAEDRVEGAAWLMLCLPRMGGEDQKKYIKETLDRLTPAERSQAEAAAIEIEKTL